MHTCQHEGWRLDTRQLPLLVLEAPAELDGPGKGLLVPVAWVGTPHTDPPTKTVPVDSGPSTAPDSAKTSD